MANDIARVNEFKSVLNDKGIWAQLKNMLKENFGAFMSSMIDLYSGDSYLQRCDPHAVAMECLKAASLKLPLVKSLGLAYVVPYKNVPTFIIGYKGLIQLGQRSGMYKTINADVVYKGEYISKDKLSGSIDLSGEAESDEIVGYFGYFKLINGFEKTLYMSREEAEAWRDRYSKTKSNQTPWYTEFDKMAMKTALRRLIGTYGPMSNEMQMALTYDAESDAEPDKPARQTGPKAPISEAEVVNDPEMTEEEYQQLILEQTEKEGF